MSRSFWTGSQHLLGKSRRKVHTSSVRLPGECRASPSLLHAVPCSRSTPVLVQSHL